MYLKNISWSKQTKQNQEKTLFSFLPFDLQDNARIVEGYRKRQPEYFLREVHIDLIFRTYESWR